MAVYIPGITSDQHHLVMMKTTTAPPADGDWDNQDNAVLPAGNSPIISLWAHEASSDIHIATQQQNGRVAYHVFDPTTDTWTTRDEKVAVIGDHADFDSAPNTPGVSIGLRSDGDRVIIFTVHDDGPNLDKVIKATNTASSWTIATHISQGASDLVNPVMMGPDSSDRLTSVALRDSTVVTLSISSADVDGTMATVDASIDTADMVLGPGIIDSSNKIYVPYIDSDNEIAIGIWTSAAIPSVSVANAIGDATVFGHGRTTAPFAVVCLAVDGTTVHLVYSDDTDKDLQHDDQVAGSGTTDTEIKIGTGDIARISINKGTTDLLYVYDDAGTVKYDEIAIGGVGLSPSEIITMLNRDKISPIRQM